MSGFQYNVSEWNVSYSSLSEDFGWAVSNEIRFTTPPTYPSWSYFDGNIPDTLNDDSVV